jgi:quercetin dioxygenase-like cupin family protein
METLDLTALARAAKLNERADPVGQFDGRSVKVSRFSEHPRWELHPQGDELLQVIEGELQVILLDGTERTEIVLGPGQVFIIPANVWHSPLARGPVCLLSMADYEGTRVSNDDDPRSTP